MKAGVCTIAMRDMDIFAAIDTAAAAGAEGIEVWGKPPHVPWPAGKSHCSELRDHAAARGVSIRAFGSYYRAGERELIDNFELTPESQVEAAAWLGADLIRVWAGGKNYSETPQAARKRVTGDLRRIGDLAGERGIGVVVERHANTLTNGWDSPAKVLAEVDHDNVKLNYQLVYPAPADEIVEKYAEDLTANLRLSAHAHLQNYTKGPDGELTRCYLDEGIVDYRQLASAAQAAGFDGFCMVEFLPVDTHGLSTAHALKRDISFLAGI